MSWASFFQYGMKKMPEAMRMPTGKSLELGPGNTPIGCDIQFDLPGMNIGKMEWPLPDESVGSIWTFHCLEHLDGTGLLHCLSEAQRVLKPEGVMNIMVPYYKGQMAWQDPDHKTWFTEDTWKTILSNPYYRRPGEPIKWKLEVGFNMIMGLNERNLGLFTQLRKRA